MARDAAAIDSAARAQSLADLGISLVIAMLAWPFPIARAMMSLPVHLVALVAFWLVVHVGYFALTTGVWRRTPAMRLLGLDLVATEGPATSRRRMVLWGVFASLAAAWFMARPTSAARAGERVSGVRLVLHDGIPRDAFPDVRDDGEPHP